VNAAQTIDAVQSLASRRLGAIRIGPGRSRANRPVTVLEGGLEVRAGAGEWIREPAALAIRGPGRVLAVVWDADDRLAVAAVASRLAQEVGARRAARLLARGELDRCVCRLGADHAGR
jgi:hypothetical protein